MDVMNAIRNDRPLGDSKLGALHGFTRKTVEQRGSVSQTQLKALYGVGYSRENLLEVISAIALKTMNNYANHLVATELNAAFQDRAWAPTAEP